MSRSAAWFLRRYRDGNLSSSRMRQLLERELERLVAGHSALQSEMDELRRAAADRLAGFDTASDLALRRLGQDRFDLALPAIESAARDLQELRRCVAVAVDWRRTSSALTGVEKLLSPGLESQATPRVLRRLRDLARTLLDDGEARKARFVVLLLADQIRLLTTRGRGDVPAVCQRWIDDLATQDPMAAAQISKLAHEGFHTLAERLADDLLAALAAGDRARRASAAGGSLGPIARDLAAVRRQASVVHSALARWLETTA